MVVRPAEPADAPDILDMIRELADYEGAVDEVQATEELLHAALFGNESAAYCHVAVRGEQVIGLALWFLTFSTWLGRHGMYLEDLYVRPEARGTGAGVALLRELAAICVDRGYQRLDWQVLDWNEPARRFYDSLGARGMPEWVPYRLAGQQLRDLAERRTDRS